MQKKLSTLLFDLENNGIWIGCVKHSFLLRENTFHRVSICYETLSRFQILLKQNLSSWIPFGASKKNDRNTAMQIKAVFRTL